MVNYLHINHNDMRNQNLALILKYLHQNGPISRAELSIHLGMNKASISTIIRDLINRGIVVELGVKKKNNEVGAPSINLMINPDAGRVIAIEVGHNFVKAKISDLNLNFLWRLEKTLNKNDLKGNLLTLKTVISEACLNAKSFNIPVIGLSLGIPGMVDINKNVILFAPELGWDNIDLNYLMEENGDIPFYTGIEAHMSALGEMYFGSTQKSRSSIFISWGQEVRGGIIVNQTVMPGGLGLAGEVGHYIINPNGELCTCGKYGCWNTLINQNSIEKRIINEIKLGKSSILLKSYNEKNQKINWHEILSAAQQGDKLTLDCLKETGFWLGLGISNLINLTNPEFVILGGPLCEIYEFIKLDVIRVIDQNTFSWQRNACQIQLSSFREDSCLIGGVATVLWNILNNPQDTIR